MEVYRQNCPYLYRGKVEENNDPMNLGRCRVRVPSIHGELNYSVDILPWARPISFTPVASNRGSVVVPEIGDIVWVLFEGADRNYPVYFGGTYGDGDIDIDTNKVILYLEDGNQISYNKSSKSYQLSAGSNGIILTPDNIMLKGDILIEGSIEMTGDVNTGASISIPEVGEGESYDTFDYDGSGTGEGVTNLSEKYKLVTNGVGINRTSDSQSFCSSLITTVSVKCRDEKGKTYTKKLSVNKYIKDDVVAIFEDIYNETTFRVRSADTGAYCYRTVSGTNKLSYHSYGVAIDLNWNLNPYSKSASGSDDDLRLRTTNHPVVQIFIKHGWGWGGTYEDHMHFSYFDGH